jgi:HD-GYP domain-containing protein (c-di-GMP phosphodiesterase class II)
MEPPFPPRLVRNDYLRVLRAQLGARSANERAHASRVAVYSVATADAMGRQEEEMLSIRYGAELHDVGKLAWPALRFTQARESLDEAAVRLHPLEGLRAIASIGWLKTAHPMILYHHERWDGNGYPSGLMGSQIPLGARIIAVAEAFDAMTMGSDWRQTITEDEAIQELIETSGRQFDPEVVSAFLDIQRIVQPVGL